MIVSQREPVVCDKYIITTKDDFEDGFRFGEEMADGRLTEKSDETVYNLRKAVLLSKRLGKLLTETEMKSFEVQ